MKTRKNPILAAIVMGVGLITAGGAGAAPVLFKCHFPNAPRRSFFSPNLQILYAPEQRRARAVDGLIWHKFRHAIPVAVQVVDARRVTFAWTVRNVPGFENGLRTTIAGVHESVTILRGSGRAYADQSPLGDDNSFSTDGQCTVTPWVPRRRQG